MMPIRRTRMNKRMQTICKLLFALLYLYLNWYTPVFGNNLVLLYGLSILLTLLVMLSQRPIVISTSRFPGVLLVFFIYSVYSLLSGFFVAYSRSVLFSSIVTFLAFSVVCLDVWFICEACDSTDWLLNSILFCAFVCSITLLFFGKQIKNGVIVTAMSETNNPNGLAYILFLGIYTCSRSKEVIRKRPLWAVFLIGIFYYSIILTGSRKIFIVSTVYLILIILFFSFGTFKRFIRSKDILLFALIFAALVLAVFWARKEFTDTALFARLLIMFEQGTDNVRFALYRDAISYWKESPIVGIGFNQYAVRSPYQFYSHSTYAEILSCGGVVGCLIFFSPLILLLYKLTHLLLRKGKENSRYFSLLVLYIGELGLGIVMIYIYNISHMLILTYISYSVAKELDHERLQEKPVYS